MTDMHEAILFEASCFDFQSKADVSDKGSPRYYGKDVADYLCEKLQPSYPGCSVNQNFWGWAVNGQVKAEVEFEIAVYNKSPNGPMSPENALPQWGLWIHCFVFRTFYEFVRVRVPTQVPPELTALLIAILENAGATLKGSKSGDTSQW